MLAINIISSGKTIPRHGFAFLASSPTLAQQKLHALGSATP